MKRCTVNETDNYRKNYHHLKIYVSEIIKQKLAILDIYAADSLQQNESVSIVLMLPGFT